MDSGKRGKTMRQMIGKSAFIATWTHNIKSNGGFGCLVKTDTNFTFYKKIHCARMIIIMYCSSVFVSLSLSFWLCLDWKPTRQDCVFRKHSCDALSMTMTTNIFNGPGIDNNSILCFLEWNKRKLNGWIFVINSGHIVMPENILLGLIYCPLCFFQYL